jgi:hypothetical protein
MRIGSIRGVIMHPGFAVGLQREPLGGSNVCKWSASESSSMLDKSEPAAPETGAHRWDCHDEPVGASLAILEAC